MEIDDVKRAARIVNLVVTVVLLLILAAGLGVIAILSAQVAAHVGSGADRHLLGWLSAVAMTLLSLVLVLLFWVIVRHVRARLSAGGEKKATPYIDAWAESGKRFKLDKEEDEPQNPEDIENEN